MEAFLMTVIAFLGFSIAVGFALETFAKLIPSIRLRIVVVAVVRGLFYSATFVADSYVVAVAPSIMLIPQWISLAMDGRFEVVMAIPALIVAALSFVTSSAGFGIYRKDEAGRRQRDRQSDRSSYEAALRRLGKVGEQRVPERARSRSE
jgi:hypothetical protein